MTTCLKILLLILFSLQIVNGQQVKGIVQDRATNLRLQNVTVKNHSSNQQAYTNEKGEFNIQASINEIVIFLEPGYLPDTLLIIDLKPVMRHLVINDKMLKTVQIKGEAFNPEVDYHNVYKKAKTIHLAQNNPASFSPSRYFGKEGKQARQFKRRLQQEKTERQIDARFSEIAVKALTMLQGKELDAYMVLYRPTLKTLDKLNNEGLMFYIMDCFKAFKLLPIEKKKLPSLSIK